MIREKNYEILLPLLGILFFGTGTLWLKMYPQAAYDFLPWLLAVAAAEVVLCLFVHKQKVHEGIYLLLLALFFSNLGLIMLARLKPILFVPQMRWLILGMLVYCLTVYFYRRIEDVFSYQYILGIACLILLCSALLFGTEIGGSKNWIVLGPVQVQPSEFGKILLVLFLAAYLADHRQVLALPSRKYLFLHLPPLRFIAPLLCIWSLAILMFVIQKDLGSALLFFGITIFLTYMATGNKSYVFIAVSLFAGAAAASYFLFGHVKVRFDIWLHPWQDPNGQAYQIVQSLFAFASGGVLGSGFAHGYPGFIPEVHTDFIFSAVAEEFGLVGSMSVMLAYMLFFALSIAAALRQKTDLRILLLSGFGIVFFLQAFIIIAGVTKFFPLTGITLPFISYGGSSMVSSFILLGLMTALTKKENGHG